MWRTLRDDAALVQHQHAFAERQHFLATVRDIENRNAVRLIPAPQIVEDLRFGRGVESRKRFVEQEDARVGYQSSRQGHALALSARYFRGTLLPQVFDAKLLQHLCSSLPPHRARQKHEAVFGILLDRQMREEREILQDITHSALGHRSIETRRCVEQDALTGGDSAGIGSGQPGHAIEQCGLPRARRAEDYGESWLGAETHIEREHALRRWKALADAGAQS